MPQTVWDLVDVRLLAVRAVVDGGLSVREAADRHRIGKSQLGEWVRRYRELGAVGLAPRSRRPVSSPGQTSVEVEDAIVGLHKERLGRWGAKKLRTVLLEQGYAVPAVSTVQAIMVRRGLVDSVRVRPVRPDPGHRFERGASNELWQIDGTMHRFCNGASFWVVDVIDDHSRFLTGALVGPSLTGELAWNALRLAVSEHGLPQQLLSDNGTQFTGRFLPGGPEVRFERQARAAGIGLLHGRPYHPQTQGKIERQHKTQNDWITDHRPRGLAHAQEVINAYRLDYNTVRPHEGIGQVPPARRYVSGTAIELPVRELDPADDYPAGALLRRVDHEGRFRYSNKTFIIDSKWNGITIGCLHRGRSITLYYGQAEIASIHVGDLKPAYTAHTIKRS